MRVERRNVFETNSSSSHSISIESSWGDRPQMCVQLPKNTSKETLPFDILRYPLIKDGRVYDEVNKLRIVVSLINEYLYYSYREELKKEWVEKTGEKFRWSNDYANWVDKKLGLKGAKNYVLKHKYWNYLNSILKKRLNIFVPIYETSEYFPFVSDFVDDGLGCESKHYYESLGLRVGSDKSKESFVKEIENVIFNPDICIEQSTSARY